MLAFDLEVYENFSENLMLRRDNLDGKVKA